MTTTPKFFRTNDMAFAAFLALNGHPTQGTEWQGSTCFWQFLLTPAINGLLDTWNARDARVEPVAYNQEFNSIKKELWNAQQSRG